MCYVCMYTYLHICIYIYIYLFLFIYNAVDFPRVQAIEILTSDAARELFASAIKPGQETGAGSSGKDFGGTPLVYRATCLTHVFFNSGE